jgi:uncharacterized membrane protein YhaH (DUF805 family)
MLSNIYKLFFSKLFSFKSRSNRKEYNARVLLNAILMITWSYTIDIYGKGDTLFSFLYVVFLGSLGILMFFQFIPLSVRRFHDINCNGWWSLLFILPFTQIVILWLMFKKGTSGTNDYGEVPEY